MFYQVALFIISFLVRIVYPMKIIGRENIPEGAAVVCCNHSSLSDPVFLAIAVGWRYRLHYMAKYELGKIPVFVWILRAMGVILVRRGESDITAIKKSLAVLKEGEKLGIFPEGRRVREEELGEGKAGAAMLAARTGAPVLPAYIPPGRRHPFVRIVVVFGRPFTLEKPGKGEGTRQDGAEAVMDSIRALQKQYG